MAASQTAPAPTPAYAAARSARIGAVTERRATPADAFRAAREIYLRCERIDMQALAQQLGVSRGTLYRWTGDRERLLVDVVWSFAEELFEWTEAFEGQGADLVARRAEAFMHVLATAPALRAFLTHDPERAFRILTRRGLGVEDRAVARLTREIEEDRDRGSYAPRLEPGTLALAIVRIIEGYVYNDTLAGIEPDLASASRVIRALLD